MGSKYFLPRPTKACKIVRTMDQFFIYYKRAGDMKTEDKESCSDNGSSFAEYNISQPQIGGKTAFDNKILTDFPWFCSFSASKYTAACIMDYVNKSQCVCVEPDVIDFAFKEVIGIHDLTLRTSNSERRLKLMTTYASRQNISVVGYPCCFHQDYTGTLPSLENKKCFEIKHWSNKGVGRGGGSPGTFVVAFLDWTSHKSGSRRNDYLSLTRLLPKDVPRVTEQMWVRQFGYSYDTQRNDDTEENRNTQLNGVSQT